MEGRLLWRGIREGKEGGDCGQLGSKQDKSDYVSHRFLSICCEDVLDANQTLSGSNRSKGAT